MPVPTLQVADCHTIAKTFERAACYAPTEESVFAMMTPILTNMRANSQAFIDQQDANDSLTDTNLGSFAVPNLKNVDKADEEDEGFFEKIGNNFFPGDGDVINPGGIFNSECIPCGFRLNSMGELISAGWNDFGAGVKAIFEQWGVWLMTMIQQIKDLLGIFSGLDKYIDLCALIKFFKEFVCIPDIMRILSALMALMARVSFEFGGLFDLILSLVAPLLTPFLSGIVDQLQQFILMIIKPLECIIDSIQDIIRKLDYNVLFQNIEMLDKTPKKPSRRPDPRGPIQVPFQDVKFPFVDTPVHFHDAEIDRRDIVQGEGVFDTIENAGNSAINNTTDALGGSAIKQHNAEKQRLVEAAAAELAAVESNRKNVDGSSPSEVERYKKQKKAAQEKYDKAVEERDLSALGRANKRIDEATTKVKSALFEVINFLREAAQAVETFFNDIFGELQKLMGQYVGGSGSFIELLTKKSGLVQIISFITALLKAFIEWDTGCDEDEQEIRVESVLPVQQGMKVWTDENGDLHIEEDDAIFDEGIQKAVEAIGAIPPSTPTKERLKDRGELPSTEEPRQKLKSLIEFTGDPVLDIEIARATEALITPAKVTFKCPLQSSVSDAEQVNQWIKELNTE